MRRRGLFGIAVAALLAVAACESAIVSGDDGLASLTIVVAAPVGGPLAAPASADAYVVILSGPTNRQVNGTPGERLTISGLAPGSYTVRVEAYANGVLVWFAEDTVTVTAGQTATADLTAQTILENVPTLVITSPSQDATVVSGDAVTLSATAMDQEDGDLTADIEWDSDLDGALGTGGTISPTLSDGVHVITATVHDQVSQADVQTVGVTVAALLVPTDMCADYPGYSFATFEDANLEGAVRTALSVPAPELLTCDQLATLTQLAAEGLGIVSLEGIQNLVGLDNLIVQDNAISDVGPLSGLTSLMALAINQNPIVDIDPLGALTNLDALHICGNQITDASALASLTNLVDLRLCNGPISDINALSGLTQLTFLQLFQNPNLSDIGALSGLTSLSHLEVFSNAISDLTPLSGLTALTTLDLDQNSIVDISPLSGLTNLIALRLDQNSVVDIAAVAGMTGLTELDLNANAVADVDALSGLTSLTRLNLGVNSIVDISPLTGLVALTALELHDNPISDISALSALTALTGLSISSLSGLTDISALSGLTALSGLGVEWNPMLSNIQPLLDNTGLGAGDEVFLRGTAVSCPDVAALEAKGVTVSSDCSNDPPAVTISEPSQDTTVTSGDPVTLTATADDPEDGDLSASITWSSDLDGPLGTGGSVTPTLSAGLHTVTATVEDQSALTATAMVSIGVGQVLQATDSCADVSSFDIATFADANLGGAVRTALGIGAQDGLTCERVASLAALTVNTAGIASLDGAQNLTGLGTLILNENAIVDLAPLEGLTGLTTLELEANQISDVSPLSGLTGLTWLEVDVNMLSDISALAGLTSLTRLDLDNNAITDIGALSGMTSMTELDLDFNTIVDIGALSGMTVLDALDLDVNSISDLSPLSGLTSLTNLQARANSISDISPLSGLTGLTVLGLGGNSVTDVGPLEFLTSLTSLLLPNNASLSDIQPLLDNTGLGAGDGVDLQGTAVSCGDVVLLEAKGVTVSSDCSPPVATIAGPAAGSFSEQIDIDFSGTGDDPEDGSLTGLSLGWVSSLNGFLGTGTDLTTATLSVGTHTITLTATDSDGQTGTDQVVIDVVGIPSGRIAYRFESGGSGVGIVNGDGTSPSTLRCCSNDADPAWAPDGSRIAFEGGSPSFALDSLHFIDPDGTNLTLTSIVGSEFAWSPSLTDVVFTRSSGGFHLFRADINTMVEQQLTFSGQEFDPAWSPDGTQIAFENGAGSIDVINSDGTGLSVLTAVGTNGSPKWSPDGSRIAFDSDRAGSTDVWIMDADGSNAVRITTDGANDVDPTWSADGEWLAFSSDRAGDFSLYVVFVGGVGAPIFLDLPATADETHPSWEP